MSVDAELLKEFLIESSESLDQLDRDLVALEENPRDAQRLSSIFRTVHNIKGICGFLGFVKLGAIAHSGEHLLGRLRDGSIDLDERVTGALLSFVDTVRVILGTIERTGGEGDGDYRDLSQSLATLAEEAAAARARSGGDIVVTRLTPPGAVPSPPPEPAPAPVNAPAPTPAPAAVPATSAVVEPVAEVAPAVSAPPVAAPPPPPAAAAPAAKATAGARPTAAPVSESAIRVDVGLLGALVDLVGELVLARNQLQATVRRLSSTRGSEDAELLKVAHRIDTVTGALQTAALKTRMQPIDQVFNKFPRVVRDLAVGCGKEVQLTIQGADTELDRSLIETIRDPLTHLLRNAVDHGIEPPSVRIERGKPATGTLALRAFHESGQVTIEITDDGGGIRVEAVREKAIARGLVSAEQAALLPDERVFQFIFEPGFSTAATVTAISGRGVGMDVVRTNIEAIGGTVELDSRPGLGTTVRVRIPLTLAIMPALIVHAAGQRFAIPQAAVRELIALGGSRSAAVIEGLDGAPVTRLRDRLLPLVFLRGLLGLDPGAPAGTVIVLRVDSQEFGLVVDGVALAEDIVVKPIARALVALGVYAGATVLGDGDVVLIVDPRGVAQVARIASRPPVDESPAAPAAPARPRYLVCESQRGRRMAVPLEDVQRLETFPRERLEEAAGRLVAHREGQLLPLADVDAVVEGSAEPVGGAVTAVIVAPGRGDVGLRVRRILEVVEPTQPLDPSLAAAGLLGTVVIDGRAIEVVDVGRALAAPAPRLLSRGGAR
ncbi:MAG: chemotaxis protein CheA [Planctomycetes bacterium]|nr:chemotaxis protein CheA [Planctomycetota bacterium]